MPEPHHEFHPKKRQLAAPHHVLPHEVKGFLEGGIAAVVAGVSTHPLDLIKVRMQLLGEGSAAAAATIPKLATAGGSGSVHVAPRMPFATGAQAAGAAGAAVARPGALEVAAQIIRTQGAGGLFSGVSATALRQV